MCAWKGNLYVKRCVCVSKKERERERERERGVDLAMFTFCILSDDRHIIS